MRLLRVFKSRSRASWSEAGDAKRLWQGRRPARPNPYFRGKRLAPTRYGPSRLGRVIAVCASIGLVIAGGYYFGFGGAFTLHEVSIQSDDTYLLNAINRTVEEQKNQARFFIFPQSNLLAFSITGFNRRLRVGDTAGYLDALVVEKVFPHTLRVTATKRETGLYLVSGAFIMDISKDGHLITNLESTDVPIEDFSPSTTAYASFKVVDRPPLGLIPLVYASGDIAGPPGSQILSPEFTKKLIDLFGRLRQGLGLKVMIMTIVGASPGTIEVKIWNGPRFYLLVGDLEASYTRLTSLWLQTDAKSRAAIDYIDLRYAERVFVKKKE